MVALSTNYWASTSTWQHWFLREAWQFIFSSWHWSTYTSAPNALPRIMILSPPISIRWVAFPFYPATHCPGWESILASKTFEVSAWGWECGCGLNITFRSQLATICKCWGNILFEISQINIYSVNFINITLQNINVKTFGSNSKLFWEFKVSPFDSKLYKSTRFVIQRAWKYLKIISSFKKGMARTTANNDFPKVKTF